jgi:3-hydroxyacyl-CoA dehydrogenase
MRWGFGMKQGPFELWQEAGWKQVAEWSRPTSTPARRCAARRCRPGCSTAATACTRPKVRGRPPRAAHPAPSLPVYQRQYFPEAVLGSGAVDPLKSGTELFKNDEVRVWTLDGEVVIASITAKMHPSARP